MELKITITDINAIRELTNHTNQQRFIEEAILYYAEHIKKTQEPKQIKMTEEELDRLTETLEELFSDKEEPKKDDDDEADELLLDDSWM